MRAASREGKVRNIRADAREDGPTQPVTLPRRRFERCNRHGGRSLHQRALTTMISSTRRPHHTGSAAPMTHGLTFTGNPEYCTSADDDVIFLSCNSSPLAATPVASLQAVRCPCSEIDNTESQASVVSQLLLFESIHLEPRLEREHSSSCRLILEDFRTPLIQCTIRRNRPNTCRISVQESQLPSPA